MNIVYIKSVFELKSKKVKILGLIMLQAVVPLANNPPQAVRFTVFACYCREKGRRKDMIFVTITNQKKASLKYPHELPINWVGYSFTATQDELWDHNKGVWVLGDRARNENYVAFVFSGIVCLVAKISTIHPYPGSKRSYFEGTPLKEGNRAYDKWINQEVRGGRNPIRYERDPELDGWEWKKNQEVNKCLDALQDKYPEPTNFVNHLKTLLN